MGNNVFSWYLSFNPDEDSEILFGGWDTDRFEGQIMWHPVVNQLFWSLELKDVLVGGESTGFCTREGANCTVCPDSGTSLSTFPSSHFKQFQQTYGDKIPCKEGDELKFPDLTYIISNGEEDIHYNVPSHHWIRRQIDHDVEEGGSCSNNLTDLDVNQPGLDEMHILGDVFMQLFYTIHDRDNNRVGFARAVHDMPEILVQFDSSGYLAEVKTLEEIISETLES